MMQTAVYSILATSVRPLADVTHDVSNKMPFVVDVKHVIKVLSKKCYISWRFLRSLRIKIGHVAFWPN